MHYPAGTNAGEHERDCTGTIGKQGEPNYASIYA
jgi:hypothetical protein